MRVAQQYTAGAAVIYGKNTLRAKEAAILDLHYSGLTKKLLFIAHLLLKFCDGSACLPHALQHPERAARLLYLPLQQGDLLTDRCRQPSASASSSLLKVEQQHSHADEFSLALDWLRQKHARQKKYEKAAQG